MKIETIKNTIVEYVTIFLVTLISSIILGFFSYQKTQGSTGFMESLYPFFNSFGNSWPNNVDMPLLKSIFYGSGVIGLFVLVMLVISKGILYLISKNQEHQNDESQM
jgi:hypothetical protein